MFKLSALEQMETQVFNLVQHTPEQPSVSGYSKNAYQNAPKPSDCQIEVGSISEGSTSFQENDQEYLNEEFVQGQTHRKGMSEVRKTLMERMHILYNQIISSCPFQNIINHEQVEQSEQIDQVQEFIEALYLKQNKKQIQRVLLIISKYPCIREFLQWIYDAAPILFYKELILATCNLTLAYFSLKTLYPEQSMVHLSQNIIFLNQIFNDPSLRFLKVSCQAIGINQFVLLAPSGSLNFINYFTQKFLQILPMFLNQLPSGTSQNKQINIFNNGKNISKSKKSKAIKKQRKGSQ